MCHKIDLLWWSVTMLVGKLLLSEFWNHFLKQFECIRYTQLNSQSLWYPWIWALITFQATILEMCKFSNKQESMQKQSFQEWLKKKKKKTPTVLIRAPLDNYWSRTLALFFTTTMPVQSALFQHHSQSSLIYLLCSRGNFTLFHLKTLP